MQVDELTFDVVRDAKPASRRYVIWCETRKGLGVRVSPNGDKTYVVKTRKGRGRFADQRWITIGSASLVKFAKARDEAETVLAMAPALAGS